MSVEALPAATLVLAATGVALAVAILVRLCRFDPDSQLHGLDAGIARLEQGLRDEFARDRQESAAGARSMREEASGGARALREEVQQTLRQLGDRLTAAVTELSRKSETQQEALRNAVEGRLDALRSENSEKLE